MQTTGVVFGSGSYGSIIEAFDSNKNKYAIKCNLIDTSVNFIGTIRELDVINRLFGHPNIVHTDFIYFRNPFTKPLEIKTSLTDVKCDSIYFVFKPARNDLLNNIHNLTYTDIKKYMLDMLLGLEFMHSKNIIHQDIKPGNILISTDNIAQLCDFGLGEPMNTNIPSTKGVYTCWYRAPEICQGQEHLLNADVWAIACVFIEMLTKRPILENCPDKNSEVIKYILTKIPVVDRSHFTANDENLQKIKCKFKDFLDLFKLKKQQLENFNATPGDFHQFIDLISAMLLCNPKIRFTSTECLNHNFFRSHRDKIQEFRQIYQSPEIHCMSIISSDIRRKVMITSLHLFDTHTITTPKVIFSSISLFDRYMSWCKLNPEQSASMPLLSDTYEDALLKYYVCLYIFVKYFNIIVTAPSFKILVDDKYKELYSEIDTFERRLIRDVCKSKIYVPTVLEAVSNIDSTGTRKLLLRYMESSSVDNVNVTEYAKILIKDL
jgi:serine/threonine protein kinase